MPYITKIMFKNISKFIQKDKKTKGKIILRLAKNVPVPEQIDKDLKKSFQIKEVINKFVANYIKEKKSHLSKEQINNNVETEIKKFEKNYIEKILPSKLQEKPTNLYEMSDAKIFASTNLVTRSLSTTMGHLWERLANCSDVTLSTEEEFAIKIKGIDIIFIKNNKPIYTQIKTLEGTLTGSQADRSKSELSIHEQSIFVAAFNTGTGWTFGSDKIPRKKGKEFWEQINIDYDFILKNVKTMIKGIENNFSKLNN